jgi:ATP-dependent DNA ligase
LRALDHRNAATHPVLLAPMMQQLGPEEAAIPSRWQHDALPSWRRISAELVCEIQATTIDAGRRLRQPATFLRWRLDLRPEDCSLDQLRR